MVSTPVVIVVSFAYLGVLFAIAHWADRRAAAGRSVVARPTVYALSIAVYATSWTFFGSVGWAATTGMSFLAIYVGPTVMAGLWWLVLRKMIRIAKERRITSLADFVASRYGKSSLLGGLVTVIAVVGIVPYIALQLKAVSGAFNVLTGGSGEPSSLWADKALYVALVLAAFTIAFGTRRLDATERHEGMVAAIAFESVVKLVAFLVVGAFVTFGLFGGFGDLFGRAAADPELRRLFTLGDGGGTSYGTWAWLIVLSMLAILFLPRQFQVQVVENVDERHLNRAMWVFPLYLLAINIFVMPLAVGGLLTFGGAGAVEPDTFVLALPLSEGQGALALLVFIGGLSAATGMVIVETIALSTMVSNSLVLPAMLRGRSRLVRRRDLGGLTLGIRRATIVLVLLLGYVYFRLAGEAPALVAIGLVSFAAVAQFAPAVLGGLFWKGGNRLGALAGLLGGFAVWVYTLLLPSFARSGWLPESFITEGPLGIGALRPQELLGLGGLDEISHAMIWSMLVNVGLYVGVSLVTRRSPAEHGKAAMFVDAFDRERTRASFWRGSVTVAELRALLERFMAPARVAVALDDFAARRGTRLPPDADADADLVNHVEMVLAGSIGTASARVMVASVADEEPLELDEVMEVLEEASEVRAANERLRELDRLKDDFVSTVTHELRTPLTSIRAFSEILRDTPDLEPAERDRFLGLMADESERLTRLINQVLDLSKLESGRAEWDIGEVDLGAIAEEAVAATEQIVDGRPVRISLRGAGGVPPVAGDRDRVKQVLLNLLSNAVKFCDPERGRVEVRLGAAEGRVRVDVRDNGPGIEPKEQETIFEKFRQSGDTLTDRPGGTGLGLPISREIVARLGGRLWVESRPGRGTTFSFTLPRRDAADGDGAIDGDGARA